MTTDPTNERFEIAPLGLTPVPKGMCPAFYQFMGAGSPRSDSGEILMLEADTTNPATTDRQPTNKGATSDE
jgi:hypothetical protein